MVGAENSSDSIKPHDAANSGNSVCKKGAKRCSRASASCISAMDKRASGVQPKPGLSQSQGLSCSSFCKTDNSFAAVVNSSNDLVPFDGWYWSL